MTSAAVVETQVWFGGDERPLYGWVASPQDGQVRGGVVLCPPLGREVLSTHRLMRHLSRQLAGEGYVALRFDYDGTGDSSGADDDPNRVEAWLGSIEKARAFLLELGAPRVGGVGIRLGALLLAFAAQRSPDAFDALVLWDPCGSGRAFVREEETLLAASYAGGVPRDPRFRHTPGVQFTTEAADDLSRLGFADLPVSGAGLARRILLLQRDDRVQPQAVLRRLEQEQSRLTIDVAVGQAELMDVNILLLALPQQAMDRVCAWLGDEVADPVPLGTIPERHTAVVTAADGDHVRETARYVGGRGMFGVVSEPVAYAHEPVVRPWITLMSIHHTGMGRFWVNLAREWAAQGYRVIRLDQTGIGDSDTHPGQMEGVLYSPLWIDDALDLVRTLRDDGSPLVMVGVSVGAYYALEAALWERVDAVVAVSPGLRLKASGARWTPYYTRRRRAAVGATPSPEFTSTFPTLLPSKPVVAFWRVYCRLAPWKSPFAVLRRVVRRGTRLVVIANTVDMHFFKRDLVWRRAFARLSERDDVRIRETRLDELDHALLARGSQQLVREEATRFVRAFHEDVAR